MHVLLFDIDGTLIHAGGSGLRALKIAFAETFDRAPPAQIDTAGRTDRGIARDMFSRQSIEDSFHNWSRFRESYLRHLADQMPRRRGRVLPGVAWLLDQLAGRPDVATGLLTGNVAEGARIKLEHFGLNHHFAFGGFGEHHPERNAVAEEALRAAHRALNGAVCPERVWVIGDTALDIACARHINAHAVAVATGLQARSELAAAAPDLLLDDLRSAAQLLRRLDEVSE
jgi:phosphoglycolate phosphatase-like HAD superfamily hydrolase